MTMSSSSSRIRNPYEKKKKSVASLSSSSTFQTTTKVKPPSSGLVVQNPYAKKQPAPAPVAPLEDTLENQNPSVIDEPMKKAAENHPHFPEPKQLQTSSNKNQQQQDVEYWKRMPSKQISLGPAEILTVPEVLKHGSSLYKNAHVRVTGVLLCKHMEGDGTVVLELGDPLVLVEKNSSSTSTTTSTAVPSSNSALKTPAPKRIPQSTSSSSSSSSSGLKRPVIGSGLVKRRRRSYIPGLGPPPSSKKSKSFRTPLVSRNKLKSKSTPSSTTLSSSSSSALRNKRSPATTTTPKATTAPTLQVRADATQVVHLETLQPQQLTMIVGHVMVAADGASSNHQGGCFLQARLVQNVAGTDFSLYVNALYARRRTLSLLYQQQQQQQDAPTTTPIQGCGPPPYENLASAASCSTTK